MRFHFLCLLASLFITSTLTAQVSINSDGSAPDNSAMLDVKSSEKGFLPPRLTTEQMNGIIGPTAGLLIYNTDAHTLYFHNGITWKKLNELVFTETDPVFATHAASGISSAEIVNWNTAFGWGDHAGKYVKYVNVKEYGAMGDDATDNTTAFANAVNVAFATKNILYIPSGIYRLNNLNIPGIRIVGDGQTSIVKLLNDDSNGKIFIISSTNNVSIDHLKFAGYNTISGKDSIGLPNNGQVGLYINDNCQDITVTNCVFEGFKGTAIYLTGSSYQFTDANLGDKFINNTVIKNYRGMYLGQRAEYNFISNTFFVDNVIGIENRGGNNKFIGLSVKTNWYGMYLAPGANDGHGSMVSCDFNHCTKYGIYVTDQQNGFDIIGNNIYISDARVMNSRGINFTGNNFGNNTVLSFHNAYCCFTGNYVNDDSPAAAIYSGTNDINAYQNYSLAGYWNIYSKRYKLDVYNGYNLFMKNDIGYATTVGISPVSVIDARTNAESEVITIGGGVPISAWGWDMTNKTSYLKSKNSNYNVGLRGYSSSTNDFDITPSGNVGVGTSAPAQSAKMEIQSTTSGLLIPRMTQAQILAIPNPVNGLMVFCTSDSKLYIFVTPDLLWREVLYGTGTISL